MHIKNIHSMIEKLSEVAKCELDKGVENIDTKEMGEVADIIKELSEAEYYAKISKAMDEAEYGEDYDLEGPMEENRKGYRGRRRDSRGRFMSNRGRRGYEIPMMMYEEDWDEMERMRDIDRPYGKMGYDGGSSMGGSQSGSQGGQYSSRMQREGMERDSREGRSGQMRRGYMEAKEKGMDKQTKMKELEDYMRELSSDVTEMIGDASPEEKSMLKNKMQVLMQKIQ